MTNDLNVTSLMPSHFPGLSSITRAWFERALRDIRVAPTARNRFGALIDALGLEMRARITTIGTFGPLEPHNESGCFVDILGVGTIECNRGRYETETRVFFHLDELMEWLNDIQ